MPSPDELPTTHLPGLRPSGRSRAAGPPAPARISRYEVTGELGRGGMGVVYRAADAALRREVAIKMILDPALAGEAALDRFRREAETTARLRHPGIVTVFESGEHEGRPYLVMELVQGESLEALLSRAPLPPRRIAEIVRGVALALEHAHSLGIVHRDVKPQNVIVDRSDAPHLMDFGLARNEQATAQLTRTGEILGTPAYMAPEQASGEPGEQGPHTDVYALGAVLYRALAGKPPFSAPTPQALLYQVMFKDPVPPRKIDARIHPELETIALRCLAKERDRRLGTAREVADELGRFLDGIPINARSIGPFERLRVRARRHKRLVAAGLVLVALAASAVVVLVRQNAELREKEAADTAELREREKRLRQAAEVAKLRERARDLEVRHDYAGEIAALERATAIDPRDAPAWTDRGVAELNARDFPRAIRSLSRAIELAPRDARAWSTRGAARRNARDIDGALADFSRAIELDPKDAVSWAYRSEVRKIKGELDDAWSDVTRALALDPKSARGWSYRASIRLARRELDGAIEDATKAIELDKSLDQAWHNRGMARYRKGDLDGALADVSQAIAIDPSYTGSWCLRSLAKERKGDLAGARADADRAVELDPKDAMAWRARGVVRFRSGEGEAAIADLTRAIELDGQNAESWGDRGVAYVKTGDFASAVRDFERALELDPAQKRAGEFRDYVEKHRPR